MDALRKAAEALIDTFDQGRAGPLQFSASGYVGAIVEALRAALAERPAEPDMRHPKIQRLIGAKARCEIELGLVEQLLGDPNFETTAMDMEYWGPMHDKLKAALSPPQPQAADWRLTAARFLRDEIEQKEGAGYANRVNELEGAAAKLEMLASASPFGLDCADPTLRAAPQPVEAVDTRYEQAMQIINAAWMALPESLRQRMADAQDVTGNPLPAAVRALAEGAAVDVPVGFQLMPVEPTEAMIQAAAETPQMKTVSGAVSFCADRFHWGDDRIGGTWDTSALAEAYRAMVAQHAAARGGK